MGTSGPHDGACGLPVATPPVIVRPAIVTVGAAVGEPIVTTGPPPRIVVSPTPAPTSETLFTMMIPPGYVPGPTRTVSPSWAAFTACWIVG